MVLACPADTLSLQSFLIFGSYNIYAYLLWDNLPVCCEYVLLSLVNKEAFFLNKTRMESQIENREKRQVKLGEDTVHSLNMQDSRRQITPRPHGNTKINRNSLI